MLVADPKETRNQELFESLLKISRDLFPHQTQKAESWLTEQAYRYGVTRAKEEYQKISVNPLIWFGIGFGLMLFLRRR